MIGKILIAATTFILVQIALASAVDVTITAYGTDVTFNGETLRGSDNGSPMTYSFTTKHIEKTFKPTIGDITLDDNVTIKYGDEDVVYAGPDVDQVLPGMFPADHVLYIVHFIDGPIVIYFKANGNDGYGISGVNMPPWGNEYYKTADKLYKDYLKEKL